MRTNAASLDELEPGVYIVNGKKTKVDCFFVIPEAGRLHVVIGPLLYFSSFDLLCKQCDSCRKEMRSVENRPKRAL